MDCSTPEPEIDKQALWRRRLAGYSDSLFHFWKTKLAKGDGTYTPPRRKAGAPKPATAVAPAFAQVIVATPAAAPPAPIEIMLGGGRVLRVGAGFDSATLARVLARLEERPC